MWVSLPVSTLALWRKNNHWCGPRLDAEEGCNLSNEVGWSANCDAVHVNGETENAIDGCNDHVKQFFPGVRVLALWEV